MKIKKLFLLGVILFSLVGCTNIKDLNYNDILNVFNINEKNPNTFRSGFQFYVPAGLIMEESGSNYAIFTSEKATYYMYVDLVSYSNKNQIEYKEDASLEFSKSFKHDKKQGYIEIKLWENNQYLIEIMYNYAKIEVMVEKSLINESLINSINILNSIKYDDIIIDRLLNDDKLSYTEEVYELFEEHKNNSNYLQYEDTDEIEQEKDEIIDTDFIN